MATIKARRYANGAIRYTAIVRKRVNKKIVDREARTFAPLGGPHLGKTSGSSAG